MHAHENNNVAIPLQCGYLDSRHSHKLGCMCRDLEDLAEPVATVVDTVARGALLEMAMLGLEEAVVEEPEEEMMVAVMAAVVI